MHQECSRYTTIHYVAAQSQQQRAWGTRPVASVLSCAPALTSLDLTNSFSTWLPKTLSGMSVCLCCSSSSTSFKDPLGELQILLNDQGFSGTGLWLIPEPHSALHSLCSKTAGPRTNTQPAPIPALCVELPLSSTHLAKSYLTLKEPSGNSSPPLRPPAQNRWGGTDPGATATRVTWAVCFLTKVSYLQLCIPRASHKAWHLLGECSKFCAE